MADTDDTTAGGEADAAPPGETPTEAAASEATTQARPAPVPPSTLPADAPLPPAATGGGAGAIPTPLFVGIAIVAVAALAFGIFSFLGKNSEADKKKDAESELTSTRRELRLANDEIDAANEEIAELEDVNAQLSEDLGRSEEFAVALDQVLSSGVTAADSLYDCAVSAYEFILNFLSSGNADVGQAEAVDDRCISAEDNYNTFNASLTELAGS